MAGMGGGLPVLVLKVPKYEEYYNEEQCATGPSRTPYNLRDYVTERPHQGTIREEQCATGPSRKNPLQS